MATDRLLALARARLDALRTAALPILQAALAAALAWVLAHDAIGHKRAFFAPIAALIALGLATVNHTRRVVELTLGVAVGIAIGDVLIAGIGTGAWQLGVVVALSMAAAIALGGGPLLVSQAASSAVLVATLATGLNVSRFVDALVGGAVGLAVLVAVPGSPLARARAAATAALAELAMALGTTAAALEQRDVAAAREALAQARAAEGGVARWRAALELGQETVRLSPPFWRARTEVERHAAAAEHAELAVRNARVLARAAMRAVELEPWLPEELPLAVGRLAEAANGLAAQLAAGADGSDAVAAALGAAELATRALDRAPGLPVGHVVGQIRSLAADLLRAVGLDRETAVERVRRAASSPRPVYDRADTAPEEEEPWPP